MTKTILLADDSVTIQKVVELTFMDQDYEVVAVSDGRAAIAKLSEMRPDLVIADVHMPEATGYEVCKETKLRYQGLPVLLLVGTFEPFDLQQANAVGADSHLKKPFDSQDLLREVDTLISQAAPPPAPSFEPQGWSMEDVAPLPSEPATAAPTAGLPGPPPLPDRGAAPAPKPAASPAMPSVSAFREPPAAAAAPSPAFAGEPELVAPIPVPRASVPAPGRGRAEPVLPEPEPLLPEPEPVLPEPEPVSFEPEPVSSFEPVFESEEVEIEAEPAAARPYEPQYFSSDEEPETEYSVTEEPAGEDEDEARPPATAAATATNGDGALSDEDVDRIARRVVQLIGDEVVRQVAWDVVPDLAEVVIKERIKELESQVE